MNVMQISTEYSKILILMQVCLHVKRNELRVVQFILYADITTPLFSFFFYIHLYNDAR